ncbi:MAG: hypothetical protein ACLRFG_01480 [Clostridia bacterium]
MIGLSQVNSGISGEFYVAAELTKRGYVASLTSKNTKAIDILASNSLGSKVVSIQVKTSRHGTSFTLGKKDEEFEENENLFYIFVNLNIYNKNNKIFYGQVEYYVVPMKKVKDYIFNSHRQWLNTLGRKGQRHNDSSIRKYDIQADDILNNFDLLGL